MKHLTLTAWHFTGNTLRDGRPIPPIGETLVHDGRVVICKAGLHASIRPADALVHAPGPILHRVRCEEIVDEEADKLVCRRRTILASIDATQLLRRFAASQALTVEHLWQAPMPDVVREYLTTLDDGLRDAARASAMDASVIAAMDATMDAARASAMDAARDAARAAARAAAMDATWAATSATGAATWAASRASARAAMDAAWAATTAAAWADFDRRVGEAFADTPTSY
ncbi:MAG: hypothetical protein MUE98_00325 [Rhodobacteraceae bacterium]|jgi:hypothetical protein|nr:hypothetical protein [Paracoccaceae bacterium]